MITIEELTKTYQETILKIILKAILMIKVPLSPQGLFAFLRGDKANDSQKEPEFFTYSFYSVFSYFTVRQLDILFQFLLKNGLVSFEGGSIKVTPHGRNFVSRNVNIDVNFLYLL